jgi:hypothetical protein
VPHADSRGQKNETKSIWIAAAIVTMLAGNASATIVDNTNLAAGWHNGTGTVDGHFTADQEANDVELGLRAAIRFVGPLTPSGTTYSAPVSPSGDTLALWNFE